MKNGKDSLFILKNVASFIDDYAPTFLTQSSDTIESYRATLSKYLSFLEDVKHITQQTISREDFERTNIEDWLKHMKHEEGLQPDTCNVRLGGLRTFLKYLSSRSVEYRYLYLEAKEIPLMKTMKKKAHGLSKEAVKAIMLIPNQSSNTGKRDLVFMIIAYGTAARISEILNIKIKSIHLDGQSPYINIIGKESKIRALYLLPKAEAHIKKYIKDIHGEEPNQDDYLFYSRNGMERNKLTSRAIEKRLSKYAKEAHKICKEVPEDLHAHQFRHARATHWLQEGLNIFTIKELLGHEQIETTMKYLDITIEDEVRALATIEGENNTNISKKWKNKNGSLKSILTKK
ncbi:MAG: tyrosine-type recombinase/integrase [Anaerovoracaceae bacterium]